MKIYLNEISMCYAQIIGELVQKRTKDNPVYRGVIYTFHPTKLKHNHIKETHGKKDLIILGLINNYVNNPYIENNPCN